jgi:hypothetical protein
MPITKRMECVLTVVLTRFLLGHEDTMMFTFPGTEKGQCHPM